MKSLTAHVEKIGFAVVALICLIAIVRESGISDKEKDIRDTLEAKRNTIEGALRDNVPEPRPVPAYDEMAARTITGPAGLELQGFSPRAAYPLLPRPKFPEKVIETVDPKKGPAEAIAVLRAPGVEAAADRGRVYVSWESSPENQHVAPVRGVLDVSTDGGATWTPVMKDELGPEDPPEGKEEKKEPKPVARPPGEEGEPRKRPKRGEKVEDDGRGEKPGTKKKLTEQDKFKNKHVFLYQNVEPKKTYQFRVRQVCRLAPSLKDQKVREPEGCAKLKSESGKTALFESQASPVVSATTPPDVELRFAGSVGEKDQAGFMANFGIRKWDPKIRDWRKGTVQAGIGEEINATVRFRNEETKATDVIELKSGYKLTDIENVEVTVTKKIMEALMDDVPVKDDDGNPVIDEKTKKPVTERKPVLDPKTGQHIMVEKEKEIKLPSQVAVLVETATGKIEKIEKREDFEARQQFLQYIEQVLKEREEESADRRKKLDDGKKKAEKDK